VVDDLIRDNILRYTDNDIDQLKQDIRGIVQSESSAFRTLFSTLYPLFSPIINTLLYAPIPDNRILSFQMAILSLNLCVEPNEKEKSSKYREDSANTLAFVQPKDDLIACVIYLLLV